MPFRLGDVILFSWIAMILYLALRGRRRPKDPVGARESVAPEAPLATVVADAGPAQGDSGMPPPTEKVVPAREATGRAINVAGIGTLFRCVEYRCGAELETEVCRIDPDGNPVSPSWVYREPFQGIVASFVNVAA